MARAIGGALGNFRGKLGKICAKIIEGETFLYARPSSFKVSYTPKVIATRKKFKVSIALATCISQLPALYAIWKPFRGKRMTVSNTIIKYNSNLSSAQAPTLNNIITPPFGFQTPVIESSISENKLTGSLVELNTDKRISDFENDLSINAVVCLSDPKEEDEPFYKIFSLSKEIADFEFGLPYNFEINIDTENAALISKYNQKIIYLAVATKSQDNKIIRYSRSYSKIC